MKRIHLFEFEDLLWFPSWIRSCLTRLIVVIHKLLRTEKDLVELVGRSLQYSSGPSIIDLCSGSGGPMINVARTLKEDHRFKGLNLTLTDLYPDPDLAQKINEKGNNVSYVITPVDASDVPAGMNGVRTMICGFHHMSPAIARKILINAKGRNNRSVSMK